MKKKMYAKDISSQVSLAIKKNWSNDLKLGNFQMWLITPVQSLRSFDLLHIYLAVPQPTLGHF